MVPPRKSWPASGSQIRLVRANGESGGMVKFVAIAGDSLLCSGINRDAVSFVPLRELEGFEVVIQDGRPADRWG